MVGKKRQSGITLWDRIKNDSQYESLRDYKYSLQTFGNP